MSADAGHTEARVTIDGEVLADADATTLRVAVSHFVSALRTGEAVALGEIGTYYLERAARIESLLVAAGHRLDRLQARRRR